MNSQYAQNYANSLNNASFNINGKLKTKLEIQQTFNEYVDKYEQFISDQNGYKTLIKNMNVKAPHRILYILNVMNKFKSSYMLNNIETHEILSLLKYLYISDENLNISNDEFNNLENLDIQTNLEVFNNLYNKFKFIGEGSFGTVFSISNTCAVKISKIKRNDDNIKSMMSGAEYLASMSACSLTPNVYFILNLNIDECLYIYQIICMELYTDDVNNLIDNSLFKVKDHDVIYESIQQMLALIYVQNKYTNIACHDHKPENFVYKITKDGQIDVRLIDVDDTYCVLNEYRLTNINIIRTLASYYQIYSLMDGIYGAQLSPDIIANIFNIFFYNKIFENRDKYFRELTYYIHDMHGKQRKEPTLLIVDRLSRYVKHDKLKNLNDIIICINNISHITLDKYNYLLVIIKKMNKYFPQCDYGSLGRIALIHNERSLSRNSIPLMSSAYRTKLKIDNSDYNDLPGSYSRAVPRKLVKSRLNNTVTYGQRDLSSNLSSENAAKRTRTRTGSRTKTRTRTGSRTRTRTRSRISIISKKLSRKSQKKSSIR